MTQIWIAFCSYTLSFSGWDTAKVMVQQVKNLPAMQKTQETQVQSLNQEHLLEKVMSTHSSILAWEMPWTEGSLSLAGCSPWGHKEKDTIK